MLIVGLLFCKIKWAKAVLTTDMNRHSKKEAALGYWTLFVAEL